jgi:hypothetical protein
VVIGEAAGERLFQQGDLLPQGAPGQLRQDLRVALPATSAAIMSRPETPKMSVATTLSLIWASSSSFSARCFSAVQARTRSAR